jgi:hypothetical protein
MIRLYRKEFWLCGAVDPHTNEILHLRLCPTTTDKTDSAVISHRTSQALSTQ